MSTEVEWQESTELLVVCHFIGKTGRSKDAVNGKRQNPEWKFPWDVLIPFSQTFPLGQIQAERPGTTGKKLLERTFSIWKFCLEILDCLSRNPVFSGNVPFGKIKLVFPFMFQPKFPEFLGEW